MNKVLEILGKWNGRGQSGQWKGRAIVEEDGWFEGTVIDTNSSYQKDRLIFGIYLPESRIELLKHTPPEVSAPFVFRFFFKDEKWSGPFSVILFFGEDRFGEATLDVKEITGNADDERDIFKQINDYKDKMDDDFYELCVIRRSEMIQALKAEMEKRQNQG